jgi:hypothetical protein
MKKILFFIILALFLSGCIDKKGISLHYYPECHENYDLYGVYYENCENNICDFVKKGNITTCVEKKNRKICLDCN